MKNRTLTRKTKKMYETRDGLRVVFTCIDDVCTSVQTLDLVDNTTVTMLHQSYYDRYVGMTRDQLFERRDSIQQIAHSSVSLVDDDGHEWEDDGDGYVWYLDDDGDDHRMLLSSCMII